MYNKVVVPRKDNNARDHQDLLHFGRYYILISSLPSFQYISKFSTNGKKDVVSKFLSKKRRGYFKLFFPLAEEANA
jgi:hypothetical protein